MKRFHLSRYLYLFLFSLLSIIVIEVIIAYKNNQAFLNSEKWVNHTYQVLHEANNVLLFVKDLQSDGRGYIISGKKLFLEPFNPEINAIYSHIENLSTLTRDNASQHQRIDSLYNLIKAKVAFSYSYIKLRSEKNLIAASQLVSTGKGDELTKKIAGVLSDIQHEEELLLSKRKADNLNSIKSFRIFFYFLCLTVLLIVTVMYFVIRKNAVLQKEIVAKANEIEKKAKTFEALLENSFDGIALLDKNLNYKYKGGSAEKILGYKMEEGDGQHGFNAIHPEDKLHFQEALNEVMLKPGNVVQGIYRTLHKKGNYIWVETIITNRLNDKNVEAIVFNMRDVTNRIESEQQKDDFINMVSHELKTPVTSLKALGQILHQRFYVKKDEETTLLLSKMVGQTNKLIRLIGDLLDVNKIGGKKLHFHETIFRFDKIVSEVIEEVQRVSDTHEIILSYLPQIKVWGDKERIAQVLTNLLVNATKYSPLANKIFVTVKEENENVICAVEDFGMGIKGEEHEKIFERFYRAKVENIKTFPGLGMGLYISSEILKKQNGKIWVASKPGKGSTFYFSLPLVTAEKLVAVSN